jgi:hypothetical protein
VREACAGALICDGACSLWRQQNNEGQITLWQVVAAYVFALAGGSISTSLHLAHKPLCALISFAARTLLNPIFNM